MPYTPPSQRSPASSRPVTPSLTRSQSFAVDTTSPPRPDLPRSTSYLSRHRRTPSIQKSASFAPAPIVIDTQVSRADAPQSTQAPLPNGTATDSGIYSSPLPVNESLNPSGKATSPPESAQNSSDDEEKILNKRRGRQLENLAELQAAIRIIEQHRQGSPTSTMDEARKAQAALDLAMPALKSAMKHRDPPSELTPPLSREARKISHSRSNTDSAIMLPEAVAESPEDSDEEQSAFQMKPPMLRKKSGELVKPALRPSTGRARPSSMPGTPTYNKAVHFDSHLEHVRHFLQVDRPLAVSAGSSPVETFETEMEFPFADESSKGRSPPWEWEIVTSNFPAETFERKMMPIRVERVYLSNDNKNLIGNVAVANIAFQKYVVARFTFDYWKTTSEVGAEFSNDIRRKPIEDGYDRFNFTIKLADQAHLENKTLFFCVRYNVNGQEFWDSNNNINFQVDFKKKYLPQNGKNGMSGNGARPSNALPRSRQSPTTTPRPRSMPVSFDDFADGFDTDVKYDFSVFRQPTKKIVGESPSTIRFKPKSNEIAPSSTRKNAAGHAFGNRYDFEASLSAAMSGASKSGPDRMSEKTEWKPEPKYFTHHMGSAPKSSPNTSPPLEFNTRDIKSPAPSSALAVGTKADAKADTSKSNATGLEKPPLQSSSYHELLDKYCFVRSRGY